MRLIKSDGSSVIVFPDDTTHTLSVSFTGELQVVRDSSGTYSLQVKSAAIPQGSVTIGDPITCEYLSSESTADVDKLLASRSSVSQKDAVALVSMEAYMIGLLAKMEMIRLRNIALGNTAQNLAEDDFKNDLAVARTFSLGLVDFLPAANGDGELLKFFLLDAPVDLTNIINSDSPVDLALNGASHVGGYVVLFAHGLVNVMILGGPDASAIKFNAVVTRANLLLATASFTYSLAQNINATDKTNYEVCLNMLRTLENDNDMASLSRQFDGAVKAYVQYVETLY